MLSDEQLLLSVRALAKGGQRSPVLLLLAQLAQPAQLATIRDKGMAVGFREIKKWNIAQSLLIAAKDGQVAQLSTGWRLLTPGYKVIEEHFKPHAPLIAETRHSLQTYLDQVTDQQRKT